jgi:uncharacterized membrane protein YjgN (DUF898 family)
MAAERDLDLARYTDAVLEMALKRIDRERHPGNYARMAAELERRRAGGAAAAAAAPDPAAGAGTADRDAPASSPAPEAVGAPAAGAMPAGTATTYRPVFTATAGEYFRIWIVNLALTVATLGIYSAWAKVRRERYFHGSTSLAGSAFAYHGEPLRILKGRAIAAALLGAYFVAGQVSPVAALAVGAVLAVATPWLVVKSRLFAMRMTSWRGLRFDFAADYAGAYKVLLGAGLLAVLSLGVLLPRFIRERYRFVVSRTRYGLAEFRCEPSTWRFYKTSMVAGLMTLGGLVLVGTAAALLFAAFRPDGAGPPAGAADAEREGALATAIVGSVYVLVVSLVFGYSQARNLDATFNATTIGPHRLVSSLSARRMALLYLGNTVAILLTLGLATPWAVVRLMRYRLESIALETRGPLDTIVAAAAPGTATATGEEISGFFDVDFGL